MGKSKKTLDDYYSHIRVGMNNKFNFGKYENEKIGTLRRFVKLVKEGKGG